MPKKIALLTENIGYKTYFTLLLIGLCKVVTHVIRIIDYNFICNFLIRLFLFVYGLSCYHIVLLARSVVIYQPKYEWITSTSEVINPSFSVIATSFPLIILKSLIPIKTKAKSLISQGAYFYNYS